MNIITAYPPNIDRIDEEFGPRERREGVFYAFGMAIYNPHDVKIPPQLIAHEAVHGYRQLNPIVANLPEPLANQIKAMTELQKIELWWSRYIEDREFRFAEELVAHAAEWRYFQRANTPGDRRLRQLYLRKCSERLAGPLYGSLLNAERAKSEIKKIALDSNGDFDANRR